MQHVGQTYVLDYGDFAVRVRYLSQDRLEWEQLKGPTPGLKGVESYAWVAVRPQVLFIRWQEKDTSVVAQVVDFEARKVFTSWTSPEKTLAYFEGRVSD
jgi:hypothetical protein